MALTERFVTERKLPASLRLPRGPRWPAPVQTIMFMGGQGAFAPRWQRRYGDVYSVHVAPAGRAVVISRPEHIREVFAGPADVFHAGEGNAILGPIMGEHSVLLLDEKAHLAARKRVMAAFHGEAIAAWGAVVEQLAEDTVAAWPVDTPFGVHQHMNDISLEVILRIVFGMTDEKRLAEMRPLLQKLVRIGPMIFLGWLYPRLTRFGPWKRFDQVKTETDAVIYREIKARRRESDLAART
ncbi:MAG: cytochrome P450, partial [Jatrophihabitantaceae bacterium]